MRSLSGMYGALVGWLVASFTMRIERVVGRRVQSSYLVSPLSFSDLAD